jgi:hypothetical protein
MRRKSPLYLASLMVIFAATGGCRRDEPQVPPAATETATSRQGKMPATVTGCLRSGDAANTYVLTTAVSEGAGTPRTYQLTTNGTVKLEDHVGKRVEVSGIIDSQSQIATRESPRPADNATGTAGQPGTPTVQTGTQLSIQRMDVRGVKAIGGDCGM